MFHYHQNICKKSVMHHNSITDDENLLYVSQEMCFYAILLLSMIFPKKYTRPIVYTMSF